jgi:hypothetical protein
MYIHPRKRTEFMFGSGLMILATIAIVVSGAALSMRFYKENPEIARKVDEANKDKPWWM